jgi:hypothetical protein
MWKKRMMLLLSLGMFLFASSGLFAVDVQLDDWYKIHGKKKIGPKNYAPKLLETKTIGDEKFAKAGRTPIAFKQIAMLDSKTNKFKDPFTSKMYAPNDEISTAASTRTVKDPKGNDVVVTRKASKMKASDYYDRLNKWQHFLNDRGYSVTDTLKASIINKHAVNYTKMISQREAFLGHNYRNGLRVSSAKNMAINKAGIANAFQRQKKREEDYRTVQTDWLQFSDTKEYDRELGNRDFMAVFYNSHLGSTKYAKPGEKKLTLHDDMEIGAYILGDEIDLVRVYGDASMDNDNNVGVSAKISLLCTGGSCPDHCGDGHCAYDVWSFMPGKVNEHNKLDASSPDKAVFNEVLTDSQVWSDEFFQQKWQFQAGPIPVVLEVRVIGYINMNVEVNLTHLDYDGSPESESYFRLEPATGATVVVIGSVGIEDICEIGIGISLTLLEIGIPMRSSLKMAIRTDASGEEIKEPWAHNEIQANYLLGIQFTILKGYIFVHFCIIGIDFDIELFDWDGYVFPLITLLDENTKAACANLPWDLAARSINYNPDANTCTVVIGNNGGPIPDEIRNRRNFGLNLFLHLKDDYKPGSSDIFMDHHQTGVDINTLDPRKRLDTLTGTGAAQYAFTNDQMKSLNIPLAYTGYLYAVLSYNQHQEFDANRKNDVNYIKIARACDLAITDMKGGDEIEASAAGSKVTAKNRKPMQIVVTLKDTKGEIYDYDIYNRLWLSFSRTGNTTVRGGAPTSSGAIRGNLKEKYGVGESFTVTWTLQPEDKNLLFPECSDAVKYPYHVAPGPVSMKVSLTSASGESEDADPKDDTVMKSIVIYNKAFDAANEMKVDPAKSIKDTKKIIK